MPQCPMQLAAATSPTLHCPSPTSAAGPFWVTARGKTTPRLTSVPPWPQRQHSVFSPWIPCRERLDPGPRWRGSLTANSQARNRAEHRPARPAASPASCAGALQKYLAPPTPSLPFRTQELSNLLPPALTGRGNDWPINPLFVPVIVHLKKGKREDV